VSKWKPFSLTENNAKGIEISKKAIRYDAKLKLRALATKISIKASITADS
jgi:hypothetical protein